MEIIKTHTVSSNEGLYLQDYLKLHFRNQLPTSNLVKKTIKKGLVQVNSKIGKTGTIIHLEDSIVLLADNSTPPKPFPLDFEIIFEDDSIAVINKPAGIKVSGNSYRTIQNAIIGKLSNSELSDKLNWPKPVHRLDEPTSGILLIAKTKTAQTNLSQQFENRTIKKTYYAITIGSLPPSGQIDKEIDGKSSLSNYIVEDSFSSTKYGSVNLVRLSPHTGRKHQLRIHLAKLNSPIMGDKIYGNEINYTEKGLFLQANSIEFLHPYNHKPLIFKLTLPKKFSKYLNMLKK